jgi:hypothetical protein
MFMSAHHFTRAAELFADVARVTRRGARLIMREHSLADAETSAYYDFVHAYYAVVQSTESTPLNFATMYAECVYAEYRTPADWVQLVSRAGFMCVDMTMPKKDSFDSFRMLFIRGDATDAKLYELAAYAHSEPSLLRARGRGATRGATRRASRGVARMQTRGANPGDSVAPQRRDLGGDWRAAAHMPQQGDR